jgi:hypothetical protein
LAADLSWIFYNTFLIFRAAPQIVGSHHFARKNRCCTPVFIQQLTQGVFEKHPVELLRFCCTTSAAVARNVYQIAKDLQPSFRQSGGDNFGPARSKEKTKSY